MDRPEARGQHLRRIAAVAIKEFRQLARDRLTGGMILGLPLMQMMLFGYAINFDVRHLDAAVLDRAGSSISRQLVADLEATQVLDVATQVGSEASSTPRCAPGEVAVGVAIPADVERRLQTRERPALQLVVDGSQPTLAAVVAGVAAMPLAARHGAQPDRAEAGRAAARRVEVRSTTRRSAPRCRSCRR